MTNRVSEAVARPTRTAVQAVPAFVITEFVDAVIWNMDERQYAAIAALLLLVIGTAQVFIEDHLGKAFLRKLPSIDVPVVADEQPKDQVAEDAKAFVGLPVDSDVEANHRSYDELPESPDEMVGEPVTPEHGLDLTAFTEDKEEEDER